MRRVFSLTHREWPLKLCGALLLAGAIGLVLVHRGGRKKPAAAAALGMGLLVSARRFRADPARDEAALEWTVLGIPVLTRGRVTLGGARAVALGPGVDLPGRATGLLAPVWLDAEHPLPLWRPGARLAARRLALRVAGALGLPVRDEAGDPARACGAEELELPLGERLRRRAATPPPSLPPGSRLRVSAAPAGSAPAQVRWIAFPAQVRLGFAALPLLAAALLAAAVRAAGPTPTPAPALLGWVLAVAGAFALGLAAERRPTALAFGPVGITCHGRWLRRHVPFEGLREVVPTRAGLELFTALGRLRVPHRFRTAEDLRFAGAAVVEAARAHARGEHAQADAAPHVPRAPGGAAWAALALGAALLGGAVLANHAASTYGGRAMAGVGTVTRVTVVPGSGVQELLVTFQPTAGAAAIFTARLRETLRNPGAGATVPVVYDAAEPSRARLGARPPVSALALALTGAALAALQVGLALWIGQRSRWGDGAVAR